MIGGGGGILKSRRGIRFFTNNMFLNAVLLQITCFTNNMFLNAVLYLYLKLFACLEIITMLK